MVKLNSPGMTNTLAEHINKIRSGLETSKIYDLTTFWNGLTKNKGTKYDIKLIFVNGIVQSLVGSVSIIFIMDIINKK